MGFIKEFKQFAMRGNVIDLAIGVIIGAAFGKITNSLVADVIMPPIGLLISGIKFTALKLILKPAVSDASGKVITEAVSINYGNFLQSTVDFIIIAFAIFLLVKFINTIKRREDEKKPATPVILSKSDQAVIDIRDMLKKQLEEK
jgi:large conductance mechanosensitive channel